MHAFNNMFDISDFYPWAFVWRNNMYWDNGIVQEISLLGRNNRSLLGTLVSWTEKFIIALHLFLQLKM